MAEFEDFEEKIFFEKCLAEGKMNMASQIIIAKNSVIFEYRKQNNVSAFGPVSEKAVHSKWMEYVDQEGIDSSYFTSQAMDEIREELQRQNDKRMDMEAVKKNKELKTLLKLPVDSMQDAEVIGGALSSIADMGPTDKSAKKKIMNGMESIFNVVNETEVSHPEGKKVVVNHLGGTADAMASSLADSMIGGNFLPLELKKAEVTLDYDATDPNAFLLYVDGDRKEVEEKVQKRVVDGAKSEQLDTARDITHKIKEMISTIQEETMKDIFVGEAPVEIESKNGFQMTFLKLPTADVEGVEVKMGESSIQLPDACVILGLESCDLNETALGIQVVRWTQPLESYGQGSENISQNSNVVQIEITNRDGNSPLSVKDIAKPFFICISNKNEDSSDKDMEFIVPKFERDEDVLVYHTLLIEYAGLGVHVNIKPDNISAPLVIVYKYGNKSALNDYDGFYELQDIPNSGGIFKLFVDHKIFKKPMRILYVGIGHLGTNTDANKMKTKNLTVADMTNKFSTNYAIKISVMGCYHFREGSESWSPDGCNVTFGNSTLTCCECNHLTSFGSGFFVPPNSIDFSYVFAHAHFHHNNTIYYVLICSLCIFVVLMMFAFWKDRKDLEKLGATPLKDNDPSDKYLYEILVFTGHIRNAGTKSNVFFIVSGDDDETEVRNLSDEKREVLQRGSIDAFVMAAPRCLGNLNHLRIWHDNSGKGDNSSWYVNCITFRDIQNQRRFEFVIDKWFAVEEDDGMIDRLIPVASKDQTNEYSHMFSNSSRRILADSHIWLSVFLRPPRSRFTRIQRLCCCMAVFYLSMLTNAMYYETVAIQPHSSGFKFGPLSFSPEQMAVGIISNFIVFPPTFLMIFIFRKSSPRVMRPSRIQEAVNEQNKEWSKQNLGFTTPEEAQRKRGDAEAQNYVRKRKFCLPWWCVIIGWLLVIASIVVSTFFLWAYAIAFGDEKTTRWLSSLVIGFFTSVLITQPLKVVLIAIMVSCLCRNFDYEEDDADEDEYPYLKADEAYMHQDMLTGKLAKRAQYRPMDSAALELVRREREKEVRMYEVLREMCIYFLFLWVIIVLSYNSRDPNNFYLRQSVLNNFLKPGDQYNDFRKVTNERRFWNWTYNCLVPELFAHNWYNSRPPLGLRLFLDDRNNLKIGYAVMRQVRVKPNSCAVSPVIETVTPNCSGYGQMIYEDSTLYMQGWKPIESAKTPVPPEYKYLSASQLKGYPFWGQVDWYGGGGYVVPLLAKTPSDVKILNRRLERLQKTRWIDANTRAVFVEIGTYNAQVNLFCGITILVEFIPGGGIVPYYHIDPLRLLNYHTGFGLFQLIVEIAFVLLIVIFTVKEVMKMFKEGCSYFTQYWNIAELVTILASYTGISLHVYKFYVTAEILRIFTTTEGTGYVKLQEALLLNEIQCYLIGLVMSISTLKFLKLLRFNKRIGILTGTLKKCAEELRSYSVCLLIVFTAFVIMFWVLLGSHVREFSTFLFSFGSSISMMLKKFDYDAMYNASPIFTPIAFFTFSLATAVVLINILLTIIIRSFEEVKRDVNLQNNEYEVLDFMVQRVKRFFGAGNARVRPMPSFYQEVKKKKDAVSSFHEKINKLVNFVDAVYLNEETNLNSKGFVKEINK